jgi:hypothetical protein
MSLPSFEINWQAKSATCTQGKQSVKWTERTDQHGHPKVAIRFGLHAVVRARFVLCVLARLALLVSWQYAIKVRSNPCSPQCCAKDVF